MTNLVIDDLEFDVRRSARRRALEITVDRDGALVLSAPEEAEDAHLHDFIRRKRQWIYKQLARHESQPPPPRSKEFVEGEGFPYLGRTYRLRIVSDADAPVKLQAGRFAMTAKSAANGREHLITWYCERAKPWLWTKVRAYAPRMEVRPTGLRVQDLGYRWGSCGKGDRLYFHWKSILLPARIAEYVVVHEMAHLHEPHHTPGFWQRVERAMPDYLQRKTWLAEHGVEVEGL